jgi:membrane protein YqaA with SNARE-associated domain
MRSRRLQGWLARRGTRKASDQEPKRRGRTARRLIAQLDRTALAAPVVLLSAAVGIPPLLLVSVYAARTRMGWPVFAAGCLLGRGLRFVTIALAPGLIS